MKMISFLLNYILYLLINLCVFMFKIQLFKFLKDQLNFRGLKTIFYNIFYKTKIKLHYKIDILLYFKLNSFSLNKEQPIFYLI